jgi:hypothetical protein
MCRQPGFLAFQNSDYYRNCTDAPVLQIDGSLLKKCAQFIFFRWSVVIKRLEASVQSEFAIALAHHSSTQNFPRTLHLHNIPGITTQDGAAYQRRYLQSTAFPFREP